MAASVKVWVNNSPPQCAAEDLNGFKAENNNLIESVGLPLDDNDNFQTSQSVSAYAANGDFYDDVGTANAYVLDVQTNGVGASYVAPPNYFMGMRIRFKAGNSNTGASTVNPAGLGVIPIVEKDLTPLDGGEIGAGRMITLYYDSDAVAAVLIDGGSDASGVPTGTVLPFAGITLPDDFLFTAGQAVSRTTFLRLLSKIQFSLTGTITNASPIVTGLADTTDLYVGEPVENAGVPAGATILTIDSATQVTLSANATSTGSTTLVFFPYGNGDGSTTFNVPGTPGRTLIGIGQGSGLTNRGLGETGGAETEIPTLAKTASHLHGSPTGSFLGDTPNNLNTTPPAGPGGIFTTTAAAGGGDPLNIMNPFLTLQFIIKT